MMARMFEYADPMRIETYTPGDDGFPGPIADALLALFKRTIRIVNSRDYSPSQIAAWASDDIDPVQWRQRFAGRLVIVARIGESLAGFADVLTTAEVNSTAAEKTNTANAHRDCDIESDAELRVKTGTQTTGYLDRFYVSADFQRRGVGALIFAAIAAAVPRYGWTRLTTHASITAWPFFESRGFRTICEQTVECRGERFVNYQMEWFPTEN